uniref:Metalloendopeptidase n=1 Tax=Meloidogyne enterolobii TaxID=390850 RepID=A0A6V7UN07_MELEN|nr:unnamed protein product [Meloidogyne enterolobii]
MGKLPLWRFWILFLLFPQFNEAVIRNNRVILHDEHLPNGGDDTDLEEWTNARDEGRRRLRGETTNKSKIEEGEEEEEIKEEEENGQERRKREINEWKDRWHNKALKWGKSDEELNRIQNLLRQINELMKNEKVEKLVTENSTTEKAKKNLTAEEMSELKAWKERRMNNDDNNNKNKLVNLKKEWLEENRQHFEGDIILNEKQANKLFENIKNNKNNQHKRIKRKFIGSNIRRWDSTKPIIYSFDGSHTLREQRVIELALEHWHNITCLNFERKDDEPKGSRIVFTDVDGCASNVGRHPLGEPQFVSLAPECIRLGVIAHEVAHALGFWHEQSRPDRDLWVQVQWDNIDRDSKGQFLKEQPSDVDNSGVPYDYGSIMHYRSKAFAKLDDLFTIGTFIVDYQRTIGQRDQLSFNDIRLMNEIYCRQVCPKQLPCQRGGYTDPRHCERCRCPDGFTGAVCEQVMPGYGAECGGRIEVGQSWTKISSPNYPGEFREGQECSWLLVAPVGQRVQLQFFGEFEMYCKVGAVLYTKC